MLKKKTLDINGIHCRSCKTLIETEINALKGVGSISVNYKNSKAEVEFNDEKIKIKEIKKEIEKLGYSFNDSKKKDTNKNKSFYKKLITFIGIIGLIAGYLYVQQTGAFEILAKLNEGNVGLPIIFVIGVLAGFHCMGMCGGIVVAYTSKNMKKKDSSFVPHIQYNLGRVISYTIIGGILGGLGTFFGINPVFTGTIIIVASIFMIFMGLNFLFDLKILKQLQPKTPAFIAKIVFKQKQEKKQKAPFIVGLLTGFMPCGPLQAIQLYALVQGNFLDGATVMLVYALGTVPFLFSFGAIISSIKNLPIKKIMKLSGIIIILLGMIMINRGLASFGINFSSTVDSQSIKVSNVEKFQTVKMTVDYLGYNPNVLYIKPLIPVRWIIDVEKITSCTKSIMIESLGIKQDLHLGENIIEFTPPTNVEEIKFSCWMRMIWGKFIISNNKISTNTNDIKKETQSLPQSENYNSTCDKTSCNSKTNGACGCGG